MSTIEKAQKLAKSLTAKGHGTKNLPDALDWHFSGKWNHMFNDVPKYKKTWNQDWRYTRDLLERSVALPVLCNQTAEFYEELAHLLINELS